MSTGLRQHFQGTIFTIGTAQTTYGFTLLAAPLYRSEIFREQDTSRHSHRQQREATEGPVHVPYIQIGWRPQQAGMSQ
ncbi:hypothetical protein [Amycolatopsis thailandensis]|uniref:hypothetical protein n=1 Tax=Amycolatopsis thailandensis TaxID=589330 RepID=UPI0011779F55|nr:hypothetical protein [Amycolatopsis thailandensis]